MKGRKTMLPFETAVAEKSPWALGALSTVMCLWQAWPGLGGSTRATERHRMMPGLTYLCAQESGPEEKAKTNILEERMKRIGILFVTFTLALAAGEAATPSKITVDFEASEVGEAAEGFSTALTGNGRAGTWVIQEESAAPRGKKVLAQTDPDETSYRFPVCVYNKVTARDVRVGVRFKPVSGKVDQAAGIVWRYRDQNNYHIVRANALENNVVLYKVENGRRISLAPKGTPSNTYGVKHMVPGGKWSTLGVRAQGSLFTVFFDGKELFQVEDNTFTEAGKTGLWTKADSITLFDDLTIEVFDQK